MDILLQSDGQLYPPRHTERPPRHHNTPQTPPNAPHSPLKESTKPPHTPPPAPTKPPKSEVRGLPWEDFLLMAVAFIVLQKEETDIPLLLALAYILFDRNFSLKDLF